MRRVMGGWWSGDGKFAKVDGGTREEDVEGIRKGTGNWNFAHGEEQWSGGYGESGSRTKEARDLSVERAVGERRDVG